MNDAIKRAVLGKFISYIKMMPTMNLEVWAMPPHLILLNLDPSVSHMGSDPSFDIAEVDVCLWKDYCEHRRDEAGAIGYAIWFIAGIGEDGAGSDVDVIYAIINVGSETEFFTVDAETFGITEVDPPIEMTCYVNFENSVH